MRILIILITLFFFIIAGIYGYNYFNYQSKISEVIKNDNRNIGIEVDVHLNYYIDFNTLKYDLQEINGEKSIADVFRFFLQFSEQMKAEKFSEILIAHNGENKFKLEGSYFKLLGEEYNFQNPIYTMNHFTENVYNLNGTHAFETWTGGWLGVASKQIEDFNEFNKKWYLEDYK